MCYKEVCMARRAKKRGARKAAARKKSGKRVSKKAQKKPAKRVQELKRLEKKYVSVIDQKFLVQELQRMNKLIISFGLLSIVLVLIIIFFVFGVFQVGQPLSQQCSPYVTEQLYQKTQACNTVIKNILNDYGMVMEQYQSIADDLSPQCKQEITDKDLASVYSKIVRSAEYYIIK